MNANETLEYRMHLLAVAEDFEWINKNIEVILKIPYAVSGFVWNGMDIDEMKCERTAF